MKRIPYGIIGVGHLGSIHAKLAASVDTIDLVGVYDLDRDTADSVAGKCSTKAFDSLEDLLDATEAVSIVVPTIHHYEVARLALAHDCHLFIEKPITASIEEAKEIIRLAREKDKKVQVGHIERFNPAFLALKDHALEPMFIECHRLSRFNARGTDVSVILDLMIHDIDIVLKLIKSPLCSIDACGVSVVSEAEDIANVRLTFSNGAVANLTTSRISVKRMRKMRIFQKNRYIAINFLKQKSEIFKLTDVDGEAGKGITIPIDIIGIGDMQKKIVYERPKSPKVNSLQMQLETFVQAVSKGENTPVTGEEGLLALEVATIILDKIRNPEKFPAPCLTFDQSP